MRTKAGAAKEANVGATDRSPGYRGSGWHQHKTDARYPLADSKIQRKITKRDNISRVCMSLIGLGKVMRGVLGSHPHIMELQGIHLPAPQAPKPPVQVIDSHVRCSPLSRRYLTKETWPYCSNTLLRKSDCT